MNNGRTAQIARPISILLDAMRFFAAIVVLIGHLTQPLFSVGWPDLTQLGIASVGVFFVLSGFVIQYTRPRHADLADYARARLVRLWSVVIPALVFTGFADLISYSVNPSVYATWIHSLPKNVSYFFADVLFLNQSWGRELAFGSNNPIWSLGYEAAYYALFGAFVYLRGYWRLLIIALLVLIKGPQFLVLFPIWMLGAGTCTLILRSKHLIPALAATLLCALALWFTRRLNIDHIFHGMPGGAGPHDNFTLLLGAGLLTTSVIIVAELTRRYWAQAAIALERPIRWLAGSTFSIYLFHFPTLILIQAVTRYPRDSTPVKLVVFFAVLGFCIAVSLVTERRKNWWDPPVRWLVDKGSSLRRGGKRLASA